MMSINRTSMLVNLKRMVRTAVVAVVAAAVVGCAQIPTSSAIQQGPNVQSGLSSDYLYYSPSGPSEGQDPKSVLAGFLNAATGPQNDYAIARQFLIPKLRTTWSPSTEVLIQQGALDVQVAADNTATVTLGVSAKVDYDGHYFTEPANTKRVLKFTLVKTSGQWRISQAPDAVVMIRPVFDVIFHSYATYFFDHSYSYLVPDLRWFPARASTATRLVTAVLNGPSKWLAPALASPMPAATKLAIDAVTIDGSTAVVNLNSSALQATVAAKQYFKAQLTATLVQLAGVSNVQIQIERAPQAIAEYAPASAPHVGYAPVALLDGALTQLASPAGTQISGTKNLIRQVAATDFAVTHDTTILALKSGSGIYKVQLTADTPTPELIDKRSDVLAPLFDSRGMLWTVPTDGKSSIQVIPVSGQSHWFAPAWLANYQLKAFAISPEGSRVAMVVVDKKQVTKVLVAAIVRDSLGIPQAFGPALAVDGSAGVSLSVDWAGETGLIGLSSLPGESSSVDMLALGAPAKNIGTVAASTAVITSDSGNNIFVLTKNASPLQYRGYTWSVLADRVAVAHMPD